MDLRILFMGSPEFAVPILHKLALEFNIVGVFTQPDRPAGRKKIMTPPPVKLAAVDLGLQIYQPEKLGKPEAFETIKQLDPDLIVVAAYGQILRKNILEYPQFGCVNVHASLLPRWRGASPIYAAILNGDEYSGITIIKMDEGIDTGEILVQERIEIQKIDTQATLTARLSGFGSDLLTRTIPEFIEGQITPMKQEDSAATYSPQLKKEDGLLNFTKPALELERQVRACNPWPGAYFEYENAPVKIWDSKVNDEINLTPGIRGIVNRIPVIGTRQGSLEILQLQPPGKVKMSGEQFLNGARAWMES